MKTTTSTYLDRTAVGFRAQIIDAACANAERFWYVDRDTVIGVCPCCDGALTIRFHGTAPRADLQCEHRCHEVEIAGALRRRVA